MRNTNLRPRDAGVTLTYMHENGIKCVAKLERELERAKKKGRLARPIVNHTGTTEKS